MRNKLDLNVNVKASEKQHMQNMDEWRDKQLNEQ